ncbi:hypothetical protein LEN26_020716 [Aphanomyces euteiches]|nr:hypothetical protein LEN26_020716 [Aphanomyces euteiches]KAH9103426.1 hypothetical protein AeMF1_020243 [Aphanomyces euteiches]KAH9186000.1 hypothetical protein AeNC1_012025 [Aphanomyces euteiches]
MEEREHPHELQSLLQQPHALYEPNASWQAKKRIASGTTSRNVPASDMDAYLLAKKRQYNREKQREFRRKLELQLEGLRDMVQTLEEELNTRLEKRQDPKTSTDDEAQTSMLPWREVATVFSKSAMTSMHTNRALKSELKQLKYVAACMHRFVHPEPSLTPSPRNQYTNGGKLVLLKASDSRKMGAEWITNRLYYNADAILHQYDMHMNNMDRIGDILVSRDANNVFQYVTRHQRVVHAPFEQVCEAYERISRGSTYGHNGVDLVLSNRSPLDAELMSSLDKSIVYSQANLFRNGTAWVDNKLWRTYITPHRLLIVSQNVQSDEVHPVTPLQRNRFSIVTVDRLDEKTTMTRQLNYNSQAFSADGTYVPLDIETKQFNTDLSSIEDEDERGDLWIVLQRQRGIVVAANMERHFNAALQDAMANLSVKSSIT